MDEMKLVGSQDVFNMDKLMDDVRWAAKETGIYPCVDHSEKQSAKKRQVGGDHYITMDVQPWDVVDTWPLEQQIGYYRGGVLKYCMRLGNKDERLQEAKKLSHYAEKLVEVLERSRNVNKGE